MIVEIDRDRASALGRHRRPDRERALQRLRLAPGLAHLRADQPVPGDPGGAAASTSAIRTRCRLLYVRSSTGKLVPLDAVAKLRDGRRSAARSTHLGQLPAVTISFNLQPGVSLGDAVDRVEQAARDTLPGTVTHQLPGHGAGVPDRRCRAWACCSSWRSW